MSDLPSRSQLFETGRRFLVTAAAPQLNPAVADVPGSDLNLLLGAASLMGEELVAAIAACMKGLFVETATGDKLARVAFDRYGLTSQSANPASVDLTLSRPLPGGATPGTVSSGTRVQTASGTQFATNVDAVFGDFTTSVTVAATALTAGPDGNVASATLTTFADAVFDATLSVTNPAAAAGGTTAETDDDFKSRIRGFFPTLRRGTLGAIEFGARQVAGVAVATATEITNPDSGMPAGAVQLTVGDRDGGASSVMLQAVRDILVYYRAAGIPVLVQGGTVTNQDVIWDLDFESGTDQQARIAEVRAVTVAVAQFLAPGETLLRASLIAGARAVPGVIVNAGSLVLPAGDVVPVDNTVLLRIASEDITFV